MFDASVKTREKKIIVIIPFYKRKQFGEPCYDAICSITKWCNFNQKWFDRLRFESKRPKTSDLFNDNVKYKDYWSEAWYLPVLKTVKQHSLDSAVHTFTS